MTLQTYELDKKMLEYSISQLRNIPEYVKFCEAFCVGANTIQDTINYLSDTTNVDKAEGIWLDYLGWLVGVKRSAVSDIGDFFSVNSEDLNVEKYFWFPTSPQESSGTTLQDEYYRSLIKAKIGYNTSRCTHEENIKNIKNMTFADHCVLRKAREYDNFTTVGSPTISSDGIISNITNHNYVTASITESLAVAETWEINSTIHITDLSAIQRLYQNFTGYGQNNSVIIQISTDGKLKTYLSNTNTGDIANAVYLNYTVSLNEIIHTKLKFTGTAYEFYVNDVLTWSLTSSTKVSATSKFYLFVGGLGAYPMAGSQDLNKFSIIVDDILIYRPYTEIPMTMDITLYGDNVLNTPNLRGQIEKFLGDGVGIRNLEIKGLNEYE